MTCIAQPILREKLAELQAQARKAWAGLEREAVIEIVRSADYAAFINRIMPTDDPGRRTCGSFFMASLPRWRRFFRT